LAAARGKKAPTEGKNPQALADCGRREAGEAKLPGALPLTILEVVEAHGWRTLGWLGQVARRAPGVE
jgi:hypothetical protein